MKETFEILRSIVDFAYQQGYHELGYDIVGELETQINRINSLAIHLNSGGRDPDEKCYSKRDVEALVAITRAAEKMHEQRRAVSAGETHG